MAFRPGSCPSLAPNGLAFTPPAAGTGTAGQAVPLAFGRAVGKGWTNEHVAGADVAAVVDVGRERDRPRGQRRRAAGGGAEPGGGAGVRADRLRVLRGDAGRRAAASAAGGRLQRPEPALPGLGQRRPVTADPPAR